MAKKTKEKDADDQDDEPRAKGTKKKQANNMLWILLGGGGALALLGCCVCGGGGIGYFLLSQSPGVVGRWEVTDQRGGRDMKRELEFSSANTGTLTVTPMDGGKKGVIRDTFNYTFTRGDPAILEMEITRSQVDELVLKDPVGRKERLEVAFDADTMVLKNPRFKGPPGRGTTTYRRIR